MDDSISLNLDASLVVFLEGIGGRGGGESSEPSNPPPFDISRVCSISVLPVGYLLPKESFLKFLPGKLIT